MHSKLIKFLVEFLVENNLAYGRIFFIDHAIYKLY